MYCNGAGLTGEPNWYHNGENFHPEENEDKVRVCVFSFGCHSVLSEFKKCRMGSLDVVSVHSIAEKITKSSFNEYCHYFKNHRLARGAVAEGTGYPGGSK